MTALPTISLWSVLALVLLALTMGSAQSAPTNATGKSAEDSMKHPPCGLVTANNGQMVTVRGKARSTPHDLAFDIPGCDETLLLTFAGEEDNDVSSSELRKDGELRRFQKYTSSVYKSTGKNICMGCAKYGDVEAELTGKLEIATMPPGTTKDKSNFIRDGSGKIAGKFGWGHPGPYAAYRLVIQSVAHVKARKLPRP